MKNTKASIDSLIDTGAELAAGVAVHPTYPDEGGAPEGEDWAGAMIDQLLPPASMPGKRRMQAGYRRFVALIWIIRREATGCETVEELAEEMGVTARGAYKILREVREVCDVE